MRKKTYLFAFISMAIAISLGALGAHALKKELTPDQLDSFKTGVFYQIVHALALIGLVGLPKMVNSKRIKLGLNFLKIGPLIFSGSIYLLACKDMIGLGSISKVLGPITPIGGLIMIAGWVVLAAVFIKMDHKNE